MKVQKGQLTKRKVVFLQGFALPCWLVGGKAGGRWSHRSGLVAERCMPKHFTHALWQMLWLLVHPKKHLQPAEFERFSRCGRSSYCPLVWVSFSGSRRRHGAETWRSCWKRWRHRAGSLGRDAAVSWPVNNRYLKWVTLVNCPVKNRYQKWVTLVNGNMDYNPHPHGASQGFWGFLRLYQSCPGDGDPTSASASF